MAKYLIKPGYAAPLGCTPIENGYNFALFSRHATHVSLYLFEPGKADPFLELNLDSKGNKTGSVWHAHISSIPRETEYAYRVDGSDRWLHDPYAKSLNTTNTWRDESLKLDRFTPRGRVIDLPPFDWGKDLRPKIPMKDLLIYEMHTRAFTCDPSSRAAHRGTFLGVIEKIPHLKQLGVNAIELLPIFEFNELQNTLKNPKTGESLINFWGYSTLNFFCPMNRYATSPKWGAALTEFKTMVRELHKNGIEVILDVVYNHTAEKNGGDHTFSFKGIDNAIYYLLDPEGNYQNYSGCGNTVNCNHPVVAKLIVDSLRYWVAEMHVDGFRFDLASILTRGQNGEPLQEPPVINAITDDPVLAETKLIAEPWDAAGLYQVGSFPGQGKWAEWNGKYRDTVRRFIKGTDNESGAFARCLTGSDDLYGIDRSPCHSINFVIAHDGYTLRDLVSYQDKHNEDNGEENRDGGNDNASWNCGVEGHTTNRKIRVLRERQMRNFHVALLFSLGTPMILMGDEYGHTRNGNNNAWSQDDALNWFLWDKLGEAKDFFRFYCLVNHFRSHHPILRQDEFLKNEAIDWHGCEPMKANWGPENRFLAYTLKDEVKKEDLYIAFNAHFDAVHVTLPQTRENKKWYQIIDTSQSSPQDFIEHPRNYHPMRYTLNLAPYSAFVAKAL